MLLIRVLSAFDSLRNHNVLKVIVIYIKEYNNIKIYKRVRARLVRHLIWVEE